MLRFLNNLRARNPLLYFFGWLCVVATMVCLVLMFLDNTKVLGINAWIKPVKFLLSVWIFSWTMGWFLYYLQSPGKALYYSMMVVLVMSFELFVIIWQAGNGRLSHFNTDSPLYLNLFNAMGVAIMILTIWTAYITV